MSLSDIPEESQNEILDYLLISSLTIRRTTDDHVRLCTRASGLQRVSAAALIRRLVSDGLASAFADDWGREHLSITAKGVDRLSRRTVKELRLAREKRNADYYDYWTQSGNAFLQLAIDRATLREGGAAFRPTATTSRMTTGSRTHLSLPIFCSSPTSGFP